MPYLVEIGPVLLEKKNFKLGKCIIAISLSSFEKALIPFTQECFVPCLVEIGLMVLEKKNFVFRQFIITIPKLSPHGKGCGSSFEQILIPIIQGCFSAKFG